MYCSHCGSSNSDSNKFCLNCGKPLVPATPRQQVPQADTTVNIPVADSVAPAASASPHAYSKGCFASAWEDVRNSEGWMGKMLLLGLIMLVPILNFIVPGYSLAWAKEIACGKSSPMPKKIFADGAFALGFFCVAFGLIAGIAMAFVSLLLDFVPIIGTIADLVLTIFVTMFVSVCVLRIAVSGRFGSGFDFASVWKPFQSGFGSLFCAAILPGLVIELIAVLLAGALIAVAVALSGVGVSTYSYGYTAPVSMGAVVVALILIAIATYILFTLSSLVSVVTYRAVGHWVNRFAPNWAVEFGAAQPCTSPSQQEAQPVVYSVPVVAPPAPAPVVAVPAQAAPQTHEPSSEGESSTTALVSPENEGDSSTTVLVEEEPKRLVLIRHDGTEVKLSSFPCTIGKGSAADVQISGNNTISRVHARIIASNDGFAIEDLGSTNKTFINEDPLTGDELVALRCGDELRLGSENLIVRF